MYFLYYFMFLQLLHFRNLDDANGNNLRNAIYVEKEIRNSTHGRNSFYGKYYVHPLHKTDTSSQNSEWDASFIEFEEKIQRKTENLNQVWNRFQKLILFCRVSFIAYLCQGLVN